MNFATYFRLFTRWFWLIGLAILLSGGAAFYVARRQPPLYQAVATIQVGNIQGQANPGSSQIEDIQNLAKHLFCPDEDTPPIYNPSSSVLTSRWIRMTWHSYLQRL